MKLLAAKIRRLFVIYKIHLHQSIMQRMTYRLNFFVLVFGVFLQMVISVLFVKIIFSFIDNLSGWSFNESLLVVASYMLIEGLLWATCAYLTGISKNVATGQFDTFMVKPIDTQFLVSIWRADPEDWMRVVTALIIFVKVLSQSKMSASDLTVNFSFYIVIIICAYIISYGVILMVKSLSFWVIDTKALHHILDTFIKSSQYPTDIFVGKIAQIIFSTIIPLAFMATVPAKILIHGFNSILFFSAIFLAVFIFIISRKFFHYSIKHYSSASS